jgi:DNA polymerase-3 subunit gamma/tau
LNVSEIDAASNNGVDNIRQIVDEVAYSPTEGKYKVYIIDEVHMLSQGAFNALLKTLEEPPSYVIFILATTEMHKIPVTILSRCQRYEFKRMKVETIVERLEELMEAEGITADEKAIKYIAKCADGAMRDALSLLDQCISFHYGEKLTYENVLEVLGAVDIDIFVRMLTCVMQGRVSEGIKLIESVILDGKDLNQFVINFTWFLRNLMLVKTTENTMDLVDVGEEKLLELRKMSVEVDVDVLMRYIHIFSGLSNELKYATQKRVLLEVAMI